MSEKLIAMQKDLGLGHKGDIIITTQAKVDANLPPIAKDVQISHVGLFIDAPETKKQRDDLLDSLRSIVDWAQSRDGSPEQDQENLMAITEIATETIKQAEKE